jgi:S-ribosylhomocysteine lyase LuxS involved in autoinducer biosynthesis
MAYWMMPDKSMLDFTLRHTESWGTIKIFAIRYCQPNKENVINERT